MSKKNKKFDVFTFEIPEKYNDFLVVNLPEQYTTKNTFMVNYINGGLCFSLDDKPTKKRPLETLSEEDLSLFKKTASLQLLPDILNYGNELFPYVDLNRADVKDLIQSFYFIKPLEIISVKENAIKVTSKSLFTAKCN